MGDAIGALPERLRPAAGTAGAGLSPVNPYPGRRTMQVDLSEASVSGTPRTAGGTVDQHSRIRHHLPVELPMIVVLGCVALAYFFPDPVIIVAIVCFLLAFFSLVGAAIGGDISDPIVWMIAGFLVLVGMSSVAAARRRIQRRPNDRS